jgi:D-sedoheptulose 7-phosphate isomerase
MNPKEILQKNLSSSIAAKNLLLDSEIILDNFRLAVESLLQIYRDGGRLFLAGNGGSAADSQHLAAEFVSRLVYDRPALPAEALTTDTSALTAIANDYGYEYVFSRQLEANAREGDMFLAITTTGNSPNLNKALLYCKDNNIETILFTGKDGGSAGEIADHIVIAPGETTAIIQEIHILLGHSMCEHIEQEMFPRSL